MSNVKFAQTDAQRHRLTLAGSVAKGTSLCACCLANSIQPQYANKALKGQWKGKKATELLSAIQNAAGVKN